jgi:uncharacterized protein (TIGR02145 family)
MKSVGYWNYPSDVATNESGFSALPAGFRSYNGSFSDRQGHFQYGYGTIFMGLNTYFLLPIGQNLVRGFFAGLNEKDGVSVRCLRD